MMSDATKPAMTPPGKPRHRWLQISLGIVFVLAAIWIGWNAHIVRERQTMRQWLQTHNGDATVSTDGKVSIPIWRKWMGDEPIATVTLNVDPSSETDADRIQAMFPESQVEVFFPMRPIAN